MKRPLGITLLSLAIIAAGWLAWKVVETTYLGPRAKLVTSIRNASVQLTQQRDAARDGLRLERETRAFIDRTLGGNLESVDHNLRSRLNRLAEHVQLGNIVVGTGAGQPQHSPARSKFRSQRALREEFDFIELEGWISGSGSFEQVLRLVDSIESEPWLKRIDQLKLDPKDNGARFDVTVRLTTLFLAGRTPNPDHVAAAQAAGFDRYQPLLAVNPFRKPPAEVKPAPAPVEAAVPAPPAFPYEQWRLTGIAQGPRGAEAWLINTQSRETRTLAIGQRLEALQFVAAAGDSAEFLLGEQRFTVAVGAKLEAKAAKR